MRWQPSTLNTLPKFELVVILRYLDDVFEGDSALDNALFKNH